MDMRLTEKSSVTSRLQRGRSELRQKLPKDSELISGVSSD
ncbi:rCG48761 [Rattus norvegicus]|uniref:RCG48761 n=1 Tax=Rattus norvegicus TaxID=10116 RepID=A6IG72_RAT|nr:rCG48761 [Rattus norvegicus]